MVKILCVAEKPSIAKAVANHLGGGNVQTVCQAFSCRESMNIERDIEKRSRLDIYKELYIRLQLPDMGPLSGCHDFSRRTPPK